MPFAGTNEFLTGSKNIIVAQGPEVVAVRYAITIQSGELTLNNTGRLGILPARHVPCLLVIDSDDLDSNASPTLQFRVGVLNSAEDDLEVAWGTSMTQGQSAIASTQFSLALMRQQAYETNRFIGLRVQAAATTGATGVYGATIFYRAVR